MRKILAIIIIFLLIGTFNVFAQSETNESKICNMKISTSPFQEAASEDVVEWTWIFYDDADTFNTGDPMDLPEGYEQYSIFNTLYSGNNLNVIVLQDTFLKPANLWYINENKEQILLEEMGEINMGDDKTLSDFIMYAKNNFPADRYVLSFYSHGFGWMGACPDNFLFDFLTMDEMQKAILGAGGVDLICFTAPCTMAAFESVYELQACCDVYIGSEEGSMYLYWMKSMEKIRNLLNFQTELSNFDIGEKIIEFIETDNNDEDKCEYLTMSAIRTDNVNDLTYDINVLAEYLLDNPDYYKIIESIFNEIERFGAGNLLDLYDFCTVLNNSVQDNNLSIILNTIMNSVSFSVMANCHGSFHQNARGLTIFFPNNFFDNLYLNLYGSPVFDLDFAQHTLWDEMLKYYIINS